MMSSHMTVDEVPVVAEGHEPGSRWIMTDSERNSVAKILNLDEVDAAKMTAHNMTRERMTCTSCGKRSGVDDLVHSAHAIGIHSKEFMVDVLFNGPHGQNPAHAFDCSKCGTTFEGVAAWLAWPPWPS
ncbi:hypothetical protein TWF225_009664 [Orbilia oligospora]|uniref:Uncharacterized protein n=1 Tax=Orbilia oligospora TaxID=2813651 RepID=A0A7C8PAF5_ORBOL|nr:hypothetical protein TWF751_009577 [Orbilia oligospora]KAF3173869.1 hypothetical protein TWF225_009664 [Orbilia oligospora]KAF3244367.1 hypothetical protein TWF128_009753 [Orbilia oligospora]KAF3247109.1 hypothetical protein TWF217_009761 [Orbilia oligospora]TGJ71562.1 hypothetical protein EYR41_003522 [Orbilia oligospora]